MWEELRRKIERKKKIIWADYYKKGSRWYGVEAYLDGVLLIIFYPRTRIVFEIVFPYIFLARIFFIWRIKHLDKKEVREFRFDEKSFFKFYYDDKEIKKGLEIRSKIMDKISRRKRGYRKLIDDFMKFLEEKFPLVGYPVKGEKGQGENPTLEPRGDI
jgi:hypothetical protein